MATENNPKDFLILMFTVIILEVFFIVLKLFGVF